MTFRGEKLIFVHLVLTSISFIGVTLTNAEATYSAVGSFRRWSDAKGNCNNDGKFLAKIKNLQELKEARNVFIQHQDPKYWVGVKFDSSKNEFVWADGTEAPSNANFDAIVNKNDQLSQGYTKRCMFITNQDTLVADDCEQHYNYICQVGENDDAAEMTSSSKYSPPSSLSSTVSPSPPLPSSSLPSTSSPSPVPPSSSPSSSSLSLSSASLPTSSKAAKSEFLITTLITIQPSTHRKPSSSSSSSSPSPSPSLSSSSSSSSIMITSSTYSRTSTTGQNISLKEKLVNEFTAKMNELNVSKPESLKSAVNLTSSLFQVMNKIQHNELSTNILVSCAKLETFALQYAKHHTTSKNNDSQMEISVEEGDIALTVIKIPADHRTDVIFPSSSASFEESFIRKGRNVIALPSSLFTSQERYVVCILYNNITDLMPEETKSPGNRKDTSVGSQIISCTLSPEVQGVFTERVTIKLQAPKRNAEVIPNCVFWDFSQSTKFDGAWSEEGCTLVESTKEQTTCSCNHLTNFAVLMEVGETKISDKDKFALEIVTYIGTSLSLLGEIITVLVYSVLMNLKSTQSHIRLNMVVCLAAAQLVFVTGITATEETILCTAIAITINYLYLVAFGWMVMEGVMLYLKVVKVFNVTTTTKYFYVFPWGFPTLLVICAVTTNISLHGNMNNSMREDVCWFSFSSGFVWVFVGPVLAACLVNFVILSRILVEMVRLKDMSGITETNTARQSLKACAVLAPLLGFTWMFGVLTFTDAGLVFQYLFTVFNSLQGFFIFVLHVVRNKEIRAALEARRQRWEATRSFSMATEKFTVGRGRSLERRERKSHSGSITMNKIGPITQDRLALPAVM